MGNQVTVTSKIPSELKERLNKLGINISGLIREALKSEAEHLERERLQKLAEEAGEILQKIPDRELIEAIRIGRKAR